MRIHFKLKIYSFQKHFKVVCSTMWGSTVKQLPQELYQVGLLCLNRIQRKQMRWTMTETTCDLLSIRTLIYAYQFPFFKRMLWSMVKNTSDYGFDFESNSNGHSVWLSFFQTNKHPLKDLLFVSIHSLIWIY